MLKKSLILACILIFIQGCYSKPIPDGYTGPVVWMKDSHSMVSKTKAYVFEVKAVDGRRVRASTQATLDDRQFAGIFNFYVNEIGRDLPAGKSVVTLRASTIVAAPILALGGSMFAVEGDAEVNLDPEERYRVNGVLSKDYQAVWIETYDGEIVSEKVEKGEPPADS